MTPGVSASALFAKALELPLRHQNARPELEHPADETKGTRA